MVVRAWKQLFVVSACTLGLPGGEAFAAAAAVQPIEDVIAGQCTLLAASPLDPRSGTQGVWESQMEVEEAVRTCRAAVEANRGDPQLEYQFGRALLQQGSENAAVESFKAAAGKGYVAAQYELGLLYKRGEGVRQDYRAATDLFVRAADQGMREAQYEAGIACKKGLGVPQDEERAARYLRLAADQNHPDALYELALLYARGVGVIQDEAEAERLLQRAAALGNAAASAKLESVGN